MSILSTSLTGRTYVPAQSLGSPQGSWGTETFLLQRAGWRCAISKGFVPELSLQLQVTFSLGLRTFVMICKLKAHGVHIKAAVGY